MTLHCDKAKSQESCWNSRDAQVNWQHVQTLALIATGLQANCFDIPNCWFEQLMCQTVHVWWAAGTYIRPDIFWLQEVVSTISQDYTFGTLKQMQRLVKSCLPAQEKLKKCSKTRKCKDEQTNPLFIRSREDFCRQFIKVAKVQSSLLVKGCNHCPSPLIGCTVSLNSCQS